MERQGGRLTGVSGILFVLVRIGHLHEPYRKAQPFRISMRLMAFWGTPIVRCNGGPATRCKNDLGERLNCCRGGKNTMGNPDAHGEAPEGAARVEGTTRDTRQTGLP